ncbi:MAG: hypothetical protein NVS4B5_20260 [Vulcanimicrobiaceae bacterium]
MSRPDGDRVATTGNFVLIASEVPIVETTLKDYGSVVTALHQHTLGDVPTLNYMRFYEVEKPDAIASGLKDVLSHVNIKP